MNIEWFGKDNIMKKTYSIEVDCANCANLCEDAAKKVEGVSDVSINFMTQKMTVEFKDQADIPEVLKNICKVCRKIEPDFEMDF